MNVCMIVSKKCKFGLGEIRGLHGRLWCVITLERLCRVSQKVVAELCTCIRYDLCDKSKSRFFEVKIVFLWQGSGWYGSCNNFLQLSFWLFSLNRHVGQVLVLLWTACKGRLERLGWSEDLDLCVFGGKWTKNVKWLLPKTFSDCFNCQNTLAKHLWCRRHFGNAWQNTWLKWECGLVCFANRKTDQWSSSYFSPKPCHVLSIAKTHWLNTCDAVDTLKSFAGNRDSREKCKTFISVPMCGDGATKFQDLFPSSILALQITWTCFLTCCEPIVMVSWTWWKARAWDDLACFCPFPSNQSSKRKAVLEVPHVLLANLVTIMPCYAPTHGLVNDIVILHRTCLSGPLVKI